MIKHLTLFGEPQRRYIGDLIFDYKLGGVILIWSACSNSAAIVENHASWLAVFNVPSTARSFRDGTPIYCPLRRT